MAVCCGHNGFNLFARRNIDTNAKLAFCTAFASLALFFRAALPARISRTTFRATRPHS